LTQPLNPTQNYQLTHSRS
jgi:hypothetical protein